MPPLSEKERCPPSKSLAISVPKFITVFSCFIADAMSCRHLSCLEEVEQEHFDHSSVDSNTEDPFLDLVGSGLGYVGDQIGSSLVDAAKIGHEKCVETLLEAGADVNSTDIYGNTPIIESATFFREECLMLLLKAGADVNITNKRGETPLLRATFKEYPRWDRHKQNKCIELLLEAGANVNVADNSGYTPIIMAALHNHYKQVESFIQAGADVNLRTKARVGASRYYLTPGTTALLAAARFRHALNTFKVLLKSGAHVNIRAEPGYNSNATVEPTLNALEMTFSGGYQDGGVPPDEVLSLLHAAGETTDGTAYYEFSISSTTYRNFIDYPECIRKRQSTDTLRETCREAIRKHLLNINLHLNLFMRIPKLGLPARLADYLLYDEDLKLSEGGLH